MPEKELRVNHHHLDGDDQILHITYSDGTTLQCTSLLGRKMNNLAESDLAVPVVHTRGDGAVDFRYDEHFNPDKDGYYYQIVQLAADYWGVDFTHCDYKWTPRKQPDSYPVETQGDRSFVSWQQIDTEALLLLEAALADGATPTEVSCCQLTLPIVDILCFYDHIHSQYLQARQAYLACPTKENMKLKRAALGQLDRFMLALEDAGITL